MLAKDVLPVSDLIAEHWKGVLWWQVQLGLAKLLQGICKRSLGWAYNHPDDIHNIMCCSSAEVSKSVQLSRLAE